MGVLQDAFAAESMGRVAPRRAPVTGASLRLGGYYRISDDAERRGLGVDRQRFDTRRRANDNGWTMVREYVDNDRSASRKNGRLPERPDFDHMCRDLMSGEINGVLAWDLDRLLRDPLESELFWLMCERHGVVMVATTGDHVDVVSGEGIMVARIKAAVAAEEARKIGKRIRAKNQEKARNGHVHGGQRRYGFRPDNVMWDEHEAAILREIVDRFLAGESARGIAADLNARAEVGAKGRPWSSSRIVQLLDSPRLDGILMLKGEAFPAAWPALITPEERERVSARLTVHRLQPGGGTFTGRGREGRYLLSGLAVCERCNRPMRGHRVTKSGGTEYRCAGDGHCGANVVNAPRLEDAVLVAFFEHMTDPLTRNRIAAAREPGVDLAPYVSELRAAKERLNASAAMYGAGEIDRETFDAIRLGADKRIGDLQATIRELATPTVEYPDPDAVLMKWNDESTTMTQRRALLGMFIERVVVSRVGRGQWRRPVAERSAIHWRV